MYCWDPRQFVETPWGHPKLGAHGAQFRLESVRALREALHGIGSDLLICNAKPEDVIAGRWTLSSNSDSCKVPIGEVCDRL